MGNCNSARKTEGENNKVDNNDGKNNKVDKKSNEEIRFISNDNTGIINGIKDEHSRSMANEHSRSMTNEYSELISCSCKNCSISKVKYVTKKKNMVCDRCRIPLSSIDDTTACNSSSSDGIVRSGHVRINYKYVIRDDYNLVTNCYCCINDDSSFYNNMLHTTHASNHILCIKCKTDILSTPIINFPSCEFKMEKYLQYPHAFFPRFTWCCSPLENCKIKFGNCVCIQRLNMYVQRNIDVKNRNRSNVNDARNDSKRYNVINNCPNINKEIIMYDLDMHDLVKCIDKLNRPLTISGIIAIITSPLYRPQDWKLNSNFVLEFLWFELHHACTAGYQCYIEKYEYKSFISMFIRGMRELNQLNRSELFLLFNDLKMDNKANTCEINYNEMPSVLENIVLDYVSIVRLFVDKYCDFTYNMFSLLENLDVYMVLEITRMVC